MKRAALLVALALPACTSSAKTIQRDSFVTTFHALRPSVVLLTMNVAGTDPKHRNALDEAYGSGFVVASGTWGSQILTAEHVVRGARDLRATIGERHVTSARVLATDAADDLALVETSAADLPAVTLGNSADLEPGAPIGIAGYPIPDAFRDEGLGVATSVFSGRISSIRKDSLELDVPIIPGESGGPVFDARTGAVIGLADSRFEEERAIGFAVPIDDAKRFLRGRLHARDARP